MAGKKRAKQVARAKYERQESRRASSDAKRKTRTLALTAIIVLVAVIGITVVLANYLNSTSPTSAVAGSSPASSAQSAAASVSAAAAGSRACIYRPGGTAARKVGLPPPGSSLTPATEPAAIHLSEGTVTVSLLRAAAPCTVNSFVYLAKAGFYNNTPCHRLTTGSLAVLQCGDPTGTGTGGPGYAFNDENLTGATYPAGTVAMANSGPNTNGSQFFIVYADSTLSPAYTPFGHVVSGLNVVKAIAARGVKGGGSDGAPAKPVTITSITTGG